VNAQELLRLADDELILGWRNSEWTGIAPFLEEDVAFSSIAQTEIGHARAWYELAARELDTDADSLAFDREPDAEEKQPVYPRLLIGGIVLMAVYAVLVPVLGFIIGTFLFLAAFMYVGGYRDHAAIWGTTTAVTIFCGILFLRIAYVSLPRGVPPFDRATDIFFAIPSLW